MNGYWLTDAQGRLLDVNEAYCQMSGYSRAELLTMTIQDLEVVDDPATIPAMLAKITQRWAMRFKSLHRHKNGTLFPVEISVRYQPQAGGRFTGFLRVLTELAPTTSETLALENRGPKTQLLDAPDNEPTRC